MAAGKRSSAARKTAGIKGKRITAKQRVARVKNIAVARSHKKKRKSGGLTLAQYRKNQANEMNNLIKTIKEIKSGSKARVSTKAEITAKRKKRKQWLKSIGNKVQTKEDILRMMRKFGR